MDLLNRIKIDYNNIKDLKIQKIKKGYIIYFESLVDQNKINNYILKNIVKKPIFNAFKSIPAPNMEFLSDYNKLKEKLNHGYTIIIYRKKVYAIETKASIGRTVTVPTYESSILGPKDSLVENYQTNLGLIKKRIKSDHLKNLTITIGKYSKSNTTILYIDNITKKEIIDKTYNILNNIIVDGINDVSELKKYLNKENKNVFPAIKLTERTDTISNALLNGKIVIIMDESPFALILPTFFADYINPISDNYVKNINVNFLKLLRFFCFFLSIITPAFYIAITTFNQETIPTSLLINFQNERIGVPYPALLECLITLFVCEILKESDIRFPSNYGSSISILGALVLGDAAVAAGIVSPIMIIIGAITFISSLIFTDFEIINGIRYWRFIFLFIASFYGLYGIFISLIFFLINITSYESFNTPYFYPISPFDFTYIKETLFKMKNNKRSKVLTNNIKKGD